MEAGELENVVLHVGDTFFFVFVEVCGLLDNFVVRLWSFGVTVITNGILEFVGMISEAFYFKEITNKLFNENIKVVMGVEILFKVLVDIGRDGGDVVTNPGLLVVGVLALKLVDDEAGARVSAAGGRRSWGG